MAKTAEIKIPSDIEFRVISNLLGLLIASAGLLGGNMISQRSFDFWLDDIVPLLFIAWMCFRLYRNFLSTMAAYPDPLDLDSPEYKNAASIQSEPVIVGQIATRQVPSTDQVLEEVAKRIAAKKEEAAKTNKFTN